MSRGIINCAPPNCGSRGNKIGKCRRLADRSVMTAALRAAARVLHTLARHGPDTHRISIK